MLLSWFFFYDLRIPHITEAELGHLLFSFDVGLEQLNYTISLEQTVI